MRPSQLQYVFWANSHTVRDMRKIAILALLTLASTSYAACSVPKNIAHGLVSKPTAFNIVAECGEARQRIELTNNADWTEGYWVSLSNSTKFSNYMSQKLKEKGYKYRGGREDNGNVHAYYTKGDSLIVVSLYFGVKTGLVFAAVYGDL